MENNNSYLAFDFGASSIRLFAITLNTNKVDIKEVYRISNKPIYDGDHFRWDTIWFEKIIRDALNAARAIKNVESISVDTWGVDYVWLDKENKPLFNPRSYRNNINPEIISKVHSLINPEELYKICGIGQNDINSIYRIYEDIHYHKIIEKGGKKILFMSDYILFLLCNKVNYDFTICSTSGLVDQKTKTWSHEIFEKLNFPLSIVGDINYTTQIVGTLQEGNFDNILSNHIKVLSVMGHDSACAVYGAGVEQNEFFIINGTWSLIGKVSKKTIIDEFSLKNKISNEGYFEKTYRFNRLMVGLWIQQKLFEKWYPQNKPDFTYLKKLNKESKFSDVINIDEPVFATNCDMSWEIIKFFERKKIVIKEKNWGDFIRAVQGGLISKFKTVIDEWSERYKFACESVTLIGGGNYDEIFCQRIANELGIPVKLGHPESSILGNALQQIKFHVKNINIKKIIQNSTNKKIYLPGGDYE